MGRINISRIDDRSENVDFMPCHAMPCHADGDGDAVDHY